MAINMNKYYAETLVKHFATKTAKTIAKAVVEDLDNAMVSNNAVLSATAKSYCDLILAELSTSGDLLIEATAKLTKMDILKKYVRYYNKLVDAHSCGMQKIRVANVSTSSDDTNGYMPEYDPYDYMFDEGCSTHNVIINDLETLGYYIPDVSCLADTNFVNKNYEKVSTSSYSCTKKFTPEQDMLSDVMADHRLPNIYVNLSLLAEQVTDKNSPNDIISSIVNSLPKFEVYQTIKNNIQLGDMMFCLKEMKDVDED